MIWGPSPPSHCTLSSHFHASDSGHSCSRSRLGCHFLQQPAPISHLLHSTAVRSLSRCWALRLQGQATEMWFQATGHPGELHRRLQRCDPGGRLVRRVRKRGGGSIPDRGLRWLPGGVSASFPQEQGRQKEAGVVGGCSWKPSRPFSACPKRAALICRAHSRAAFDAELKGEHKSYFKGLQSRGIWVSKSLNHPVPPVQPGEHRPGGDLSLELGSWGPRQPPLVAPSFLSSSPQGPASCEPSLFWTSILDGGGHSPPPFIREYEMREAQPLPLKDTQCRVGAVGTAQGMSLTKGIQGNGGWSGKTSWRRPASGGLPPAAISGGGWPVPMPFSPSSQIPVRLLNWPRTWFTHDLCHYSLGQAP